MNAFRTSHIHHNILSCHKLQYYPSIHVGYNKETLFVSPIYSFSSEIILF